MIVTVRTVYSEDDLIRIIKQHYTKPFDLALISDGDIQMFAEQYTAMMLEETRSSGPSLGKRSQLLVNQLINGILTIDLPPPPADGTTEWSSTEW